MREYQKLRERHITDASTLMDGARRAMRASYQRELDVVEANLSFLASVGFVSPYLGLFGTVWGIMHAFTGLASMQTGDPRHCGPGHGVAFGFARLDTPGQANRWEGYDYPTFNGARLIGGGKSMVSSTDNVRDGLMGVIEFKPNDTYSTVLDMYYSKFERDETTRFMEYCLGWCHPVINPVVENNVVVGGSFSDVKPVLRNDLNTRTDKIFAIGWNNKFTFNENWSADIDLSYSKADRDEMILETYSGIANGGSDTVDFTINPSTGLPNFSYGVCRRIGCSCRRPRIGSACPTSPRGPTRRWRRQRSSRRTRRTSTS